MGRLILSFHSQGEIIYWQYYGMEPPESESIVNRMAQISGYEPYEPPTTRAGYRSAIQAARVRHRGGKRNKSAAFKPV